MNSSIFMRWAIVFVFLTAAIQNTFAGTLYLSPAAQISLLTASPGTELYSSFGHSAIWIQDSIADIDRVFNYGTFDFDTPNFYGKFIRGKLNYRLSVASFDTFLEAYREEGRAVYQQRLNLSANDRQAVMDFLVENYKPQNRYYRYDFFFDNCATRIRDLFELTLAGRLKWAFADSSSHFSPDMPPTTFRQLVNQYTQNRYWADWGIDFILGAKTDRIANAREYMFLPDYMQKAFSAATLSDSLGRPQALVAETRQLLYAQKLSFLPFWQSPTVLFAILSLFIMFLSAWAYRNATSLVGLDYLLFGVSGFLGWFLLFCWFGTDHSVLVYNWNILWAFPLNLPLALLALRKNNAHLIWPKRYFILLTLMLLIGSFAWLLLPQSFHPAVSPLIFILLIRAIFNWLPVKKATN